MADGAGAWMQAIWGKMNASLTAIPPARAASAQPRAPGVLAGIAERLAQALPEGARVQVA